MPKRTEPFRNFVEIFRETYHDEIRPLFEEGFYNSARYYFEGTDLLRDVDTFSLQQISVVPSGLELLNSIKSVRKKLAEGTFDHKRGDLNELEAYLEETILPVNEKAEVKE